MNHPAQPAPEGATTSRLHDCLSSAIFKALDYHYKDPTQISKAVNAVMGVIDEDNAALRARCERLEGALTRCTTAADTFRAQHWPRICALIAKDNKCAMADIAYPVCLSSIGQLAGAALAQSEDGK